MAISCVAIASPYFQHVPYPQVENHFLLNQATTMIESLLYYHGRELSAVALMIEYLLCNHGRELFAVAPMNETVSLSSD